MSWLISLFCKDLLQTIAKQQQEIAELKARLDRMDSAWPNIGA